MLVLLFFFYPQCILLPKGDFTRITVKIHIKLFFYTSPTTLLLPAPAGSFFSAHLQHHSSYSISLREYLQLLWLSTRKKRINTGVVIVQLFCRSYISVLKKKSNEMTRHRRWKNSNICWKCHKQQRSMQQKPPQSSKKPPKTAKYN